MANYVVLNAALDIKSDDVIERLLSNDKPILGCVSGFGDSGGDGVVNDPGKGFVIGVFKSEWSCAVRRPVDAVFRVFVERAFGQEHSERVVEPYW